MSANSTPTKEFYSLFELIFDFYNKELFDNELPYCMFIITRKTKTFGYYIAKKWINNEDRTVDEIAINPMTFGNYPMVEILQTIAHEMCHMWQQHFGTPPRSGYHNKEFAQKMQEIGLMPSDTGSPGGNTTGQNMADYIIDNGRFASVTNSLIEKDVFSNLWYDVTMPYVEGVNEHIDVLALSSNVSMEKVSKPWATKNMGLKQGAAASTEKEIKDKSKVKYSCPVCDFNVWGKIGLRIICGECKSSYK